MYFVFNRQGLIAWERALTSLKKVLDHLLFVFLIVSKKNQRVQHHYDFDFTLSLPLSILALPPSCTFDNGWCHWRPLNNSRGFSWHLGSGSTRDRLSGPDGDHTTKCNLYNHHSTYFPAFINTEHIITIEY